MNQKIILEYNKELFRFVSGEEGFRNWVYACSQHVPTIGIGYALLEKSGGRFEVSGSLFSDLGRIGKSLTKADLKLYQALCTGEHLKNVTLKWYRITKQGTEEHYFTHVLEDAIIVNIKPSMPVTLLASNEPYRHMEEVSFTYKKIKWTWEPNGIESEDSWSVQR